MGKRADETREAHLIGKEEATNDEQAEEERSGPLSAPAVDAEARDPKPVEAVTPGEDDDDEYEMVELSELVDVPSEGDEDIGDTPAFEAAARPIDAGPLPEACDADEADRVESPSEEAPLAAGAEPITVFPNEVPAIAAEEPKELMAEVPLVANAETSKELVAARAPERDPSRPSPLLRHSLGLLPPPVRVTKSLTTSSASLPPPPCVPSRTLPPPPLRKSSTSLPDPPRGPISSPPDFTISGTVPPLPKPSKNWFERALSGRHAAASAVLAAICAAGYFGAKRGQDTKSEPSREVVAALQAPETKPSPSLVATEPKKDDPTSASTANPKSGSEAPTAASPELPKMRSRSSPGEKPQMAALSPSNKPELAAAPESIAAKTEASRAEALETEVPKAGTQKSAPNAASCTLNLNTIPASRVTIDGRDLGMTPKIGISVQPGTHIVIFANADGKKVTPASCKAGEQKTVVVRLPI